MSSRSRQNSTDARNFIFAIGGIVVILLFLTVAVEKRSEAVRPRNLEAEFLTEKQHVLTDVPVVPKTTVNIQPLITLFPPLPNFNSIGKIETRKAAFIDYLTPIIEYQNRKILKKREQLEYLSKSIVNGIPLYPEDKIWLEELAEKYEVVWTEDDLGSVIIQLAERVDIIPVSLALVQAAKESSWGRSRYAVEANNLFGQWCYDVGCGVIPGNRSPDARHEVKKFKNVNDATRSYIHNLNTHPQYDSLRQIRQQLRLQHRPISGRALAEGLLFYSERRQAYVEEVKSMIRQYRLFQDRRTG